jgi:ABC-type lipoprotein export system ATPase subunit
MGRDRHAFEANGDAAGAPLLSAHGLERAYGEGATAVRALRGVDLDVPAGEMVAIMGSSGSGKSTRLHTLGALDRPDGGTTSIAGHRYDNLSDPLQALTYE